MASTKRGKRIAFTAGSVLLALTVLIGILYGPEIRSWYAFWQDFEGLGDNAQGYSEYRHRETGIMMVRVPGGTFWMGSKKEEEEQIISEYARYVGRKRSGGAKSVAAEQPRHKTPFQ